MSDKALKTLATIAWVNFFVWVAVTIALGGDALNGKFAAGRYFLGFKGHFREVSFALYLFSYIYGIVTILGLFGGVAVTSQMRNRRSKR